MITLLSYLYYLQWELDIDRKFWGGLSTAEVAIEIYVLVFYLLVAKPWKE